MADADVSAMAELLQDPVVMAFYPRPKTLDEVHAWIDWNIRNYRDHGHGLWIVETTADEFVGDCGLTWQDVNGVAELEVGYHVVPALQGRGLATEAAVACRDFARDVLGVRHLVAIVHPDNTASRRVAEKIGMTREADELGPHGTSPRRHVLGLHF